MRPVTGGIDLCGIGVARTDGRHGTGEIGERTTVSDGTATIDGDTEDYRFAAVPVETRDGEQLTVWAGAPLSAEHGAVNTALTVMLIGFPLLLAVVAWVTWLVTGRALRPVEGIRREMAAITASEDLARRVPVPGTHDEVARLALEHSHPAWVVRALRASLLASTGSDEELAHAFADMFWFNRPVCDLVPRLQGRYRLVLLS